MNLKKILICSSLAWASIYICHGQSTAQPLLTTKKDSVSYALGMDIARTLTSSDFEISLPVLLKGLEEAYRGTQVAFNETQRTNILQQYFKEVRDRQTEALRAPGREYLAALRNNPRIQATDEGVLYEVLVPADGKKPKSTDEVKVHYAGYLIDGEKFDSSYDRGEPIVLHLGRVISGWKIAVPLMSVGAKYKLYIPYEHGYGERGTGKIPPYSTLIFEIELLDIITSNEEV